MIIIKIGGGKNINWDYIAKDLKNIHEEFVIVHGANAWMKEITKKLGVVEQILTSPSGQTSRYTTKETMDILTMVYSGMINKKIVSTLQKYGMNAVGLSGVDGKLWLGKRKEIIYSKKGEKIKAIRDSATGNILSINTKLIKLLIRANYIPVITVPAVTHSGEMINVDNDRAVAVMVRDLKIKKVIMLFEAPGLLQDKNDETTVIKKIPFTRIDQYIKATEGRMRKKLLGVKEAFSFGVETIHFGDGRITSPISKTLKGGGTVIC